MVNNTVSGFVGQQENVRVAAVADHVSTFVSQPVVAHRSLPYRRTSEAVGQRLKWYMKPVFYYFVWPLWLLLPEG